MAGIIMSEGVAMAISLILGTFSLGMIVMGVKWIIRVSKEL